MTSPYVRLGGSALAVAAMFVAGAAWAQSPKTAAPAAGQPGGPVKLDLIAMQSPWTKLCAKDPSTGKETCYTTRDFGQAGGQGPTLAMAVYSQAGEDKRNVRFLLPLGLLLRPGFRMTLEKGEPIDGKFGFCFPTG
jgi:invasion protein IalB